MRKHSALLLAAFFSAGVSSQALASSASEKDPYAAGFEAYAKENPALSGAIQSYLKEIEKAKKEKPELVETKEDLGHSQE